MDIIKQISFYSFLGIIIGTLQSAGIGGGPLISTMLTIGLGFNTKKGIHVTYIILMGGALASIIVSGKKKNPRTGGPLMDYSLIIITMPMIVSGSILGTIINHFFSQLVVTICFVLLFIYLIYSSYSKYSQVVGGQQIEIIQQRKYNNEKLLDILDEEKNFFPLNKILIMIIVFAYTVIVLLLKGGQDIIKFIKIEKCSLQSWICIIVHFVVSVLVSVYVGISQRNKDNLKESLGYQFESQNDKMSNQKMIRIMVEGLIAGVFGGALGMGGSMILVPAWLNDSINKDVAVSSTGPLIFFSALCSYSLALLSNEQPPIEWQIFYFVLGFVSSFIIKNLISCITQKYDLKNMTYLLLIGIMVASLLVLVPFQINNYLNNSALFTNFDEFC